MFTESEIANFKKISLDELGCSDKEETLEKSIDETLEKLRNLDPFFLISLEQMEFSEAVAQIWKKFEMPPEMLAGFKDKIVIDPALSHEDHLRNGIRLGKEFFEY